MKVSIIIAVLLLPLSFTYAQKFNFGLKGGANLNKLSGMPFKEKFSYAYHAGGYFQIGLGKKVSLQPEILFNQVTSDTASKFNEIFKPDIAQLKLNYLSIPVLLNYKLSPVFDLQAGPQFGILLDHNEGLVSNGMDAFKKGELSLLGGLQANVGSFKIYGRYAVGLNDIGDIGNKTEWKSQSFQIGIGLKLL